MGLSTSNRASLRYIAEVTEGTTPATPAFKELRYTGETLGINIANVRSNEIRSDRNITDLIPTSQEAGGDVNFEMSHTAYDDWLEALLCGTWATNVLKNGTTGRSFTIQRQLADATSGNYHNFTAAKIDTLDLDVTQGQVVTGKWGVKARAMAQSDAQIVGATFVAAPANNVMSSVAHIAQIKEDNVATTEYYRKISLSIKNNLRYLNAIASLPSIGLNYGSLDITGSVEMYFQTKAMMDKYLNRTAFSLSFQMVDGAKSYTVLLPKVKFETGQVQVGGLDQDIVFTGNIRALYEGTTELAQIKITRVP